MAKGERSRRPGRTPAMISFGRSWCESADTGEKAKPTLLDLIEFSFVESLCVSG